MASCRSCGVTTVSGQKSCYKCMADWSRAKIQLFNEAKAEYGELSPETLPKIQKYVKKAISSAKRVNGKKWWEAVLPANEVK